MKERKMNNKGFSLVELIIVIAIMAILVVVLAPQYLRYVERSRNSTDYQNATEMVTALQVYAADPDVTTNTFTTGTFTLTTSSTGTTPSDQTNAVNAAFANAGINASSVSCVSRTNWDAYIITVTVASDGQISFAYSSTLKGAAPDTDAFAATMGSASSGD